MWTGCIWLRMRPMAGCFEQGNEPSGSIKGGEFCEVSFMPWPLYCQGKSLCYPLARRLGGP